MCCKNLIRLHIAHFSCNSNLMPHFLNRKESQLRSSDHIKKIAFPTAQGSYVAVLSVWELGLLSAKKIEYFDWKILRPLILAHCPCQQCNWEFVILVFHHLTKDYTALRGFCRSEVTTKSRLNRQIITCIFVNKQNTCFCCIE